MQQVKDQQAEKTVSDAELLQVMADFLNLGHVENIVAMYRQDHRYYDWTGDLLIDERFAVRLGVSVLFEYLIEDDPYDVALAVPSLVRQLGNEKSWVRGEAVNVMGIIGSREALDWVKMMIADPDDQVVEVARDILQQAGERH